MSQTLEFRLRRTADDSIETDLFDAEYTDARNRFARHALAWIDDDSRSAWSDYPRGTAVEIEVSPPGESDYSTAFAGFVIERTDEDRNGRDVLELEIYSFDHFLRREQVNRDFGDDTISQALEDIVTDFTPVEWVAGNVDVVNDEVLTRGFEGERVDNAIAELASKSAGELFGVNDDLEFFFGPDETDSAPRGIDNSQWLDYDFPERNAEGVNEIQLFYGQDGSEGSVVVRDGADQQEMQDRAGTDAPVRFREEVTREDIDDEGDARDKAQELLAQQEPALTGEIATFGLFGADPGDVLPVEIGPRGIDEDFRIAQLRYRLGDDATGVTVLERRAESQDEQLVDLSDTLKRVEQRAADRDAPTTTFEGPLATDTQLRCSAKIGWRLAGDGTFQPGYNRSTPGYNRDAPGWQGSTERVDSDGCRATATYLDGLRDVWRGETGSLSIDEMAVGTDPSQPSRTDSSLGGETQREPIDATRSIGQTEARFEATFPEPDALIATSSGVFETVDVSGQDSVWVEVEGTQGEAGEDGAVGAGATGGRGAVCQGLVDVADADNLSVIAATGRGGIDGGEEGEEGEGDAGDGGDGAGSSGVVIDLDDGDVVALDAGGGGGGGGGAGIGGDGGGDGGNGGEQFGDGAEGGAGGDSTTADGGPGGAGRPYHDEERVELFAGEAGHSEGSGDGEVRIYEQPPMFEIGLFDSTTDELKMRAVWDHGVEIQGVLDRDADIRMSISLQSSNGGNSTPTARGMEIFRDATVGDDVAADAPSQIAFGTGDADPDPSDTQLANEFSAEPIDEFRRRGVGVADAAATVANQSGNAVTLREWGVLNGADELLSRLTFADLILEDGDALTARQRKRFRN